MDPSTPPSQTMETSFLLSNLHCPSCVANIENALYALSPRPLNVSPSIVTSWVTVTHPTDLEICTIQHALTEAGFGICSVTENGIARDVSTSDGSAFGDVHGTLDSILERSEWFGGPRHSGRSEDSERLRTRHIQDCELCRTEGYQTTKPNGKLTNTPSHQPLLQPDTHVNAMDSQPPLSSPSSQEPFVVVDGGGEEDIWRASVAIGGMTCASCSNAITTELEKKSWVKNINVNLISNSATADVVGKDHVDDLISTIEDLGYEALLNSVADTNAGKEKDMWRASIAVGGMTCGSCAAAITNALQKKDWAKEVTVNLIANSASVDFKGRAHLDEIMKAIEDLGYEATLDKAIDLGQSTQATQRRTVEINVSQMFCNHCPEKVLRSLEVFGDAIRIEKPLSIKDPILRLSYVPQLPNFTIRDIIATISGLDPKFEVSIYHPPTLEERSHALHAQQQRRLLIRVALTIIIAIPTFIIGIVFMSLVPSSNQSKHWLMTPWKAQVSRTQWILFLLATPVYFLAADVFHRRAIKEIHFLWRRGNKTPILQRFYRFGSMNMLMSLGTSIAYWSSVAQLISAGANPSMEVDETSFYFDSVVFLTMFLLIGRYIEAYSKSRTGDAVTLLGKLRPTTAVLVNWPTGQLSQVPVDLLELGDTVRVMHGASPPADGEITVGETNFDEASLTGESKLVKKHIGSLVFAGTINRGSPVTVTISSASGSAMLDQIVQAVREGQTKRAPIERLADSLTSYFVPAITALAIVTWIVWLSLGLSGALPEDYLNVHHSQGGWVTWSLQFAIAVFVVACPCGLALAAPTALFVGGGLAAQHGILVKGGGAAFEKASRLDTIVFDKTGTLTMGGDPVVTEYLPIGPSDTAHPVLAERTLLSLIASAEDNSTHTLAKALSSFCAAQPAAEIEDVHQKPRLLEVHELPGRGMRALAFLDEVFTEILIGNEALMSEYSIPVPTSASTVLSTWKREGDSVVLVGISRPHPPSSPPVPPATSDHFRHLSAMFAVSDAIRPSAPGIIRALHEAGTSTWLLTGDNPITAHAIGLKLGILPQNIIAGVLPAEKADRIRDLQRSMPTSGRSSRRALVGMVGDGINDAPALAAADVGIAMGAGSDIAISAAEFVLVSSELKALATLLHLSRVVFRRIKFNFAWALVYNMIALPVAAGAFYALTPGGTHVRLDPVWASLAMAASSVSVVLSSLALRLRVPGIGFRVDKGLVGDEERPVVRGPVL
ncbi:hypothetical protein VE01_01858 [Pseudogymnoascus verrucosus]|uniref:HMA domain-containing protein n=1 Tax=Pseudogymnoascus verrucosus TaxID=342668 RepID=A0A1B8GW70_9PEZI|nr:uncharacterized protein VE01_01858 [Pseudogymnoascus verrucosus]OBU00067.1 hypothetical protein VE01_01858 [Pseudogymnoascus verrucosus]